MKIRSYLVALVLSIFVPFTIFAGAIAYKLAEGERSASVDGLRSTARALAIAVDRNIADVSNSLTVLATAELLRLREFEGFYRYASRVVQSRPELQRLVLVEPDGRILFDTGVPYGSNFVVGLNTKGLERATATRLPVVGPDIANFGAPGTRAFTVIVPALINDEVRYALIAFLDLSMIGTIFTDQKLLSDWTGVILDASATILGRSRSADAFVGSTAPSPLASAISGKEEGIVQYATQEGWATLAGFARSALTDWTVVLGMPVASANVAAGRTLMIVIATGLVVSLIALALASFLGRQISRSVLGLLHPALAMARGEPINAVARSGIAEIRSVTSKLIKASDVLAERERQRQRAEAHLARAQRVAAIGSWELALDSGELHWSDETFRIIGASRNEFRPTLTTLATIVLKEDLASVRRAVALAQRGHVPTTADLSQDFRIRRPDGAIRIVRREGEPVFASDGALVALIGTVQDVTDARAAEEKKNELEQQLRQTQKIEALGQLTGGIAHDFNNLLAVIVGNLEMAVSRQRRGILATDLDEASLRAAARGAALTRQLLAFARRQPLRPVCQDLRRLVEGMLPILERALTSKITLVFDAPDVTCWAEIDGGQFEAALLNLVINARDAMPQGGLLTIAIQPPGEDADASTAGYTEVTIKDTGTGMTREIMARAFEPFFTTKNIGKGSGLGLSMVYGFVRQSGGRVELESEPGKGTAVKLHFKRAEPPSPEAEGRQVSAARFDRRRVLLVEDEPDVRETVRVMLDELGAIVITAADGPAALDIVQADPQIDAIVTDIVMPGGIDGISLAESASALRPGIRIAFMSGYAELDRRTMLAINERPFLAKPFRLLELAGALEALTA